MEVIAITLLFNLLHLLFGVHSTPVAIRDAITGLDLPILTETYYTFKNHDENVYYYGNDGEATTSEMDILTSPAILKPTNNGWYSLLFKNSTTVHDVKITTKCSDQDYAFIRRCPDPRQLDVIYYQTGTLVGTVGDGFDMDSIYKQFSPCNIVTGAFWEFKTIYAQINRDYAVNVVISDFDYLIPLDKVLEQHKRVDMLQTSTINNCSPATISEKVTLDKKRTQSYTITMEHSVTQATSFTKTFGISAEVGGSFFGLGKWSMSTSLELTWDAKKEIHDSQTNQVSTTREITLSDEKQVNVPPETCVKVTSYINWIEGLKLPYTASVQVAIIGPSGETVDVELARIIGWYFFGGREWHGDKIIAFNMTGEIEAGYGLDSYTQVKNITCQCDGTSQNTTLL